MKMLAKPSSMWIDRWLMIILMVVEEIFTQSIYLKAFALSIERKWISFIYFIYIRYKWYYSSVFAELALLLFINVNIAAARHTPALSPHIHSFVNHTTAGECFQRHPRYASTCLRVLSMFADIVHWSCADSYTYRDSACQSSFVWAWQHCAMQVRMMCAIIGS